MVPSILVSLTYGSWASSGSLLASGSDDTYLNVWDYNPVNLAKPFTLNTSVSTGHHANIFSVKFMPHSGDRTVISCAGDSEVRVFDLEYAGANAGSTSGANNTDVTASTRSRRFNKFFGNARWLGESNTNARVYRSHADRAKRVVTESSPYLFLSCSEDGEVRQWDLRMPSAAYPKPRDSRGFGGYSHTSNDHGSDNVPPPLISYKKYNLDLNSISCAATQPQYIALGGAHLHCFLHDRRMLARDLRDESGDPGGRKIHAGTDEDESMGAATRCVKRFGPNGRRRMPRRGQGHITACKISDANPNELIASWSGDHVYSYDIVRSPDARDTDALQDAAFEAHLLRNRQDRKRKRKPGTASSSSLAEGANPSQRLRRVPNSQTEAGHTALRVRYDHGEAEDMPLIAENQSSASVVGAEDVVLSEAQETSRRVARLFVQLRKTIFEISTELTEATTASMEGSSELTPHSTVFTEALGQSSTLLPEMDEIIRRWTYPINPDPDEVTLQNTLRRNRQASWRFVQAVGCLSNALGGNLQTLTSAPDPRLQRFEYIKPPAHEGRNISRESRFCYEFLKAILCWIGGGREAVLQAFKPPRSGPVESNRYIVNENETVDNFVPRLHDYLSKLADDEKPVIDLATNRFERSETRHVFPSQRAAVRAFTRVLAEVQLQMRQGLSEDLGLQPQVGSLKRVMDRGAAARFWGVKVGRSLLMEAAEGVTFDFVNRAFGGLRLHVPSTEAERPQADVDPAEDDRVIEAIDVVTSRRETSVIAADTEGTQNDGRPSVATQSTRETNGDSMHSDHDLTSPPTVTVEDVDEALERAEESESDRNGGPGDESSGDDTDSDEEADNTPIQSFSRRRVAYGRSQERSRVNMHVPYSSHTRVYKGHCNTRTVKDVNFYGLNDEYVVSGSDDGHLFIWDRKTTKIVNILEGDGEVVNVVQGHPYEPMIACSGIDSTIKIFGQGEREHKDAARGSNVANPGGSVHSSLGHTRHRRRMRDDSDDEDDNAGREKMTADDDAPTAAGLRSRKAMHKSYEIMSQNDVERRRGLEETFTTVSGTMEELFTRAWILSGFTLV